MSKVHPEKSKIPQQNRPSQERFHPDKPFNSISLPKREIMPREFNTVSDPKTRSQTSAHTSVFAFEY